MGCPNRPITKRFLFWKINGFAGHDYRPVFLEPHSFEHNWKLKYRCPHCGCGYEVPWLSDEDVCKRLGLNLCPPRYKAKESYPAWYDAEDIADMQKSNRKRAFEVVG